MNARSMRAVGRLAAALLASLLATSTAAAAALSMKGAAGGIVQEVCAAEFISGRTLEDLAKQEFAGSPTEFIAKGLKIDRNARSVAIGAPFPAEATAVMRPGLGCVLAVGRPASELGKLSAEGPRKPAANLDKALWPDGERVNTDNSIKGVDRVALNKAMDVAFGRCAKGEDPFTRALVVVHRGRIVAERYGQGFRPGQALYGASMSKSVASTLLGLRIGEGRMTLDGVALQGAAHRPDPITNRHLVNMSAGLKWDEDVDGPWMLLEESDTAAFAASRPAVSRPGAQWTYSSGATNLLMASLRQSFSADDQAYLNYPRKALFDPLGMRSAMFQTDVTGTFLGSTYVWASARDWARLGLLYLQDGQWNGRRLLPKSWIAFVRTPAPATVSAPGDRRLAYGAGFYLKGAQSTSEPAPSYLMRGRGTQSVVIDPTRELVVVRMGYTLGDCPSARPDDIVALFPVKPRSRRHAS